MTASMRSNPLCATRRIGGTASGTMAFEFFTPGLMAILAEAGADFVLRAVVRLVAACRTHGKPAGVLAGSVEAAEAWRARGFRIFACGTDISLLRQSLADGLARLRAGARP
jgi:hypothetical protein